MKRIIYTLVIMFGLTMIAAPSYARHYDCSKAGNANKAACQYKGARSTHAAKAKAALRNYNCSKPGNAHKAVCKKAAAAAAAANNTMRPSKSSMMRGTGPNMMRGMGPKGATAQCKDGSYSHSAHHSGTCARHGGVQTWY